jgi:hypothetical protein
VSIHFARFQTPDNYLFFTAKDLRVQHVSEQVQQPVSIGVTLWPSSHREERRRKRLKERRDASHLRPLQQGTRLKVLYQGKP